MNPVAIGALIPIFVSIALFALVFGIYYLNNKEKMAMIERGMDPRSYKAKPTTLPYLKWALLLIGTGVGLFLAVMLSNTVLKDYIAGPAVYFSMIFMFGGLGLFVSYLIEKKEPVDKENL